VEFTVVEGLRTLKLDLVLTLALAAVALALGGAVQRRVGFLRRASIPAAAVGGLLCALAVLALRRWGATGVVLDTSLRAPLQTVFFTTIGLGATVRLLRAGGWRMGLFWLLASALAVVQNVVGIGVARALGAPAGLGIICGALTLTGGPATGLAFAPLFEGLGLAGAPALIIASATFGIFVSNLVGNPLATALIRRRRLAQPRATSQSADSQRELGQRATSEHADEQRAARERAAAEAEFWAVGAMGGAGRAEDEDEVVAAGASGVATRDELARESARASVGESAHELSNESQRGLTGGVLLGHLLVILAVMGVGALLSLGLTRLRLVLPGYIGAMIVAALVRFCADRSARWRLDVRAVEALGAIALALFLVLALMDLKLWQLAGLALPMLVILCVQIVLMLAYAALVTFTLMGRDYEAAVTASGHVGFGLGITPNAVANMEALVARYGPAPRSFLVVPVVGAFFIDFSNALVITLFVNLVK
jgi:ESS family glutamate:Na+ symporter